jgi:adenosylcobyric acid synthase
VQGRRFATMRAREYGTRKAELLPHVLDSFRQLSADCDLALIEGAGSPAETNLRRGDIANMGFAEAADVPVILVGDIDRGGVIATMVGTHAVLEPSERARIRGFVINRFRGEPSLFDDGLAEIVRRTGWPALGVVPYFADASRLPGEDVLAFPGSIGKSGAAVKIAVPRLPRIANFDDLDPLRAEPDVAVVIVEPGEPIPANATLVLIPGSKSTIADLQALRREGWDIDILAHRRRGGAVLGICGGFQMLGAKIADPDGVEGEPSVVSGLGLLAVETILEADKTTVRIAGRHLDTGERVAGYEIHLGRTEGADSKRPFLDVAGRFDGAVSADGLVAGTYAHGLFASDGFRRAFLAKLGARASAAYEAGVEAALDGLSAHLSAHLDLAQILAIARSRAK